MSTRLITAKYAREQLEKGIAIYERDGAYYLGFGSGRLHRNFVHGLLRRKELEHDILSGGLTLKAKK